MKNNNVNILLAAFIIWGTFLPVQAIRKKEPVNYSLLNYEKSSFFANKNNLDGGKLYLENGVKLSPNDIGLLVKLGSILIEREEFKQAIPILNRALAINPNDPNTLLLLSNAFYGDKDYKNAEKYIEKLKLIDSSNTLLKFKKGLICLKYQNNECAIEELEPIVVSYPELLKSKLALAIAYHSLKKYSIAEKYYSEYLKEDSNNKDVWYNLSKAQLEKKDFSSAISSINKAIELDPNFTDLYLDRASLFYKLSELDSAQKDYITASKVSPENPEVYYEYGIFLWKTGAYEDAGKQFNQALELQPDDLTFAINRAYLHHLAANTERAKKYWEEVLEINSKNKIALFNLAKIYEQNNSYEKAINLYSDLLNIKAIEDSVKERASIGLAYCYQQAGEVELANSTYKDLLAESPKNPTINYNYALLLISQKSYAESIKHLQEAINNNFEHSSKAYEELIKVYSKLKDNLNLEIAFKELLKIDSTNIEARIQYANFLKENGRLRDAVDQFIAASTLDSSAKSKLKLANFLLKQNDTYGAIGHLQEYLKSYPEDINATKLLAKSYQDLMINEEAIKNYKKILRVEPGNHLVHYNLGVLYQLEKKPDLAKNCLLKAIEIKSNYAPSFYALGTTHLNEKEYNKARESFERYLSLEPDGEYIEVIKKKLEEIALN